MLTVAIIVMSRYGTFHPEGSYAKTALPSKYWDCIPSPKVRSISTTKNILDIHVGNGTNTVPVIHSSFCQCCQGQFSISDFPLFLIRAITKKKSTAATQTYTYIHTHTHTHALSHGHIRADANTHSRTHTLTEGN